MTCWPNCSTMIGIDTTFLVQLEIRESESHVAALEVLRDRILGRDREAALAPQVLTEFVHIATDPRRFKRPLSVDLAVGKAGFWWNAREVARVFPDEECVAQFLMRDHGLGRKRLLDDARRYLLRVRHTTIVIERPRLSDIRRIRGSRSQRSRDAPTYLIDTQRVSTTAASRRRCRPSPASHTESCRICR